jgi:transposase
MNRMLERCAGLDVHKRSVVATARIPDGVGGRQVITHTFGTTTADLLGLRDWLESLAVTHVAMESTGVYWKPIFYVLEDGFTVLLVNAQHLKHVPGRKSDVQDSAWIAQLLENGLLRGSFVPPVPIRDLRDLTRYRKKQIQERTREVNRLQKVLEEAGLKLTSVLSDIMGLSGRAMVRALAGGTTDPEVIADLARGRLRGKLPALRQALQGRFRPHHAFLLEQILAKIDFLEEVIGACSARIAQQLSPFTASMARLQTIPGVKQRTSEVIVAETGGDMTQFPSDGHLCSWGGVCPGQEESAGRRRVTRTRHGNPALRMALIEAATAASRTKATALSALYQRIKRRRGHQRAVVAVAHQILTIAYHILARETTYEELGPDYFQQRHRERNARRHVRQLEQLGYHVTLAPAA